MSWDYDDLWEKAQRYASHANAFADDSVNFALWSTLAFELLARAALAKVHPALLAEPGDDNMLYACGCKRVDRPKSIPAVSVLKRCRSVVPGFMDREVALAQALLDRRNEELHSGGAPFGACPTSVWLAEYYRLCELLLRSQGKGLDDFLGTGRAKIAQTMIASAQADLVTAVKGRIADHRTQFEQLEQATQDAQRASAAEHAKAAHGRIKRIKCPACTSECRLGGEVVDQNYGIIDEDREIITTYTILPTFLKCSACGLSLAGHDSMHAAGLGGTFTFRSYDSPIDVFAEEIKDHFRSWPDDEHGY